MANLDIYRRYVNEIKEYAAENGISASETNKIFEKCFRTLDVKFASKALVIKKPIRIIRHLIAIVFGLFLCSILLYNNHTTHKLVLRNLQNFIYPGLKIFRKIAVPIIRQYPTLTEWYDEWCLVENPYFRVAEMDCWPCTSVRSIPDLTGGNINNSLNIGMPYTKKDIDNAVGLKDLLQLYERKYQIFDDDAKRISSNNASYRIIRDVFEKNFEQHPTVQRETHILWKITRMQPGRLIRKLFPRPAGIPNTWSQSTEKFIIIDEPRSPIYSLPNPECSNVVLKCASGSRLISMIPSPECRQSCNSFTILLSAKNTLWYNWWYWRPRSIPAVNSTDISINYLISFC